MSAYAERQFTTTEGGAILFDRGTARPAAWPGNSFQLRQCSTKDIEPWSVGEKRMNIFSIGVRWTALLGVWWALAGGDVRSFLFGIPVAGIAALVSHGMRHPEAMVLSPAPVAAFFGPFLANGILGAVDVARRTIGPKGSIRPAWVQFGLTNKDAPSNVVLGGVISVLPGTLVAGPEDGTMMVHVLHMPDFDLASLRAEETRVRGMFQEKEEADVG